MITLTSLLQNERPGKGLYKAQRGDYISIGKQGIRFKSISKVIKVTSDGKVYDDIGNIFLSNGQLYRSTHHLYKKL